MAADNEREKAGWASEYAQAQAFYGAYIEVAKEQIDRSTARAEFVQKAAGAVGAAYTAILALSFALGQTGTNPLPGRVIIPTIFLGLSIVLSTAYLAYLTKPGTVEEPSSGGTLEERQRLRRNTFIKWSGASGLRRLYFLQASIFSLGFGVAFLPAPYVRVESTEAVWVLAGICVVLNFRKPGQRRLRFLAAGRARSPPR